LLYHLASDMCPPILVAATQQPSITVIEWSSVKDAVASGSNEHNVHFPVSTSHRGSSDSNDFCRLGAELTFSPIMAILGVSGSIQRIDYSASLSFEAGAATLCPPMTLIYGKSW
jgi:hypothetical protein